jgi:hypothetical protein
MTRMVHHPSCPGDELCICPPPRLSEYRPRRRVPVCPDCGGVVLDLVTLAGFHSAACPYWDDRCKLCAGVGCRGECTPVGGVNPDATPGKDGHDGPPTGAPAVPASPTFTRPRILGEVEWI